VSARIAKGSATWFTAKSAPMWRSSVDEIVCSEMQTSVEEIDETVGRDRLMRWFADGMTAGMAADSVKTWIKEARPTKRWIAEEQSLRGLIANGAKS
jgi:hypothetical protein